MQNTRENTCKLGKFVCKTLHADYYNLRVFDLLEFLHRWLSVLHKSNFRTTFKYYYFMLSGLKVIQVLTE